jgi:hypothetical protein
MNKRFNNLLSVFLKLDYRDKEKSGKKKLIGIVLAYLFSNTFLSMNYYNTFNEQSFVVLSFSTNAFLLSFIVLNDYSNLFFSKSHIDTISSLPVSNSELIFSKFLSAGIYISFFSIAVLIPQAIIFSLYDNNINEIVLYIFTNFLFSFFLIGTILLIYTAAIYYLTEKANILLYLLQFTFLIFVMYSTSLASQAVSLKKVSIMTSGIIKYLPQNLFATALHNLLIFLICILVTSITYFLFFILIKNNYRKIAHKVYSIKQKTKEKTSFSFLKNINNFIYDKILRNNLERASYNLIKNQLRNSRNLRLKYIPLAFVPIVVCLIGIITNASAFLVFENPEKSLQNLTASILILSPTITFTLIMCSRLLITNTKISEENSGEIEWIYNSSPIESKRSFLNGTLKFINLNFIIPASLLITLLLFIRLEIQPVVLNMFYILAFLFFINSVLKLFDNKYPFTLESSKFNSASKFLEILFTIFLGIIVFIIQIFIFQNVIFVLVSIVILSGSTILFNKIKTS